MGSEGSDHGHERTAVPLVLDDLPAHRHLDGTAGLENRQRGPEPGEQGFPPLELVGRVAQREVEVRGPADEAQHIPDTRISPEGSLVTRERKEMVRTVLDDLSEKDRQILRAVSPPILDAARATGA